MADEGTGLVTTGPYCLVRHPIYLGLSMLAMGEALAFNSGPTFVILLSGIVATFVWRARAEEKPLSRAFGERYAHYRMQTKMMIPYLSKPWPTMPRPSQPHPAAPRGAEPSSPSLQSGPKRARHEQEGQQRRRRSWRRPSPAGSASGTASPCLRTGGYASRPQGARCLGCAPTVFDPDRGGWGHA
jgi:Phospholipid methyltransferase